MALPDIDTLLARLLEAGADATDLEVKSAAGGLPRSLGESLCALANLPGGGTVILGLDEATGFSPVQLGGLQALKQGMVSKARTCVPPVSLEVGQAIVDGHPVIVARVAECDRSAKPCRLSGRGWVRGWDGDYRMSELEEQAFLGHREPPRFDRATVRGAKRSDLDPALVSLWSATAREHDPRGLGRFDGEELLFRAGIVSEKGTPSRAGLLVLGTQPQQFFPRFVVNLSATETGRLGERVRARQATTLTGPIPALLEGALDWARSTFERTAVEGADGAVRDRWQYPLESVRELVANALVHRDLDAWSEGMAVEVRLTADRFVVTNPGGLYGITTDRLGLEGTTSARNGRLVEICRYARAEDGGRVVETLASGIPRVLASLREQQMPMPQFQDAGLRFTVVLRTSTPARPVLNNSEQTVFAALTTAGSRVAEIEAHTGLKPATIRGVLRALRAKGLVEQIGGRGKVTTYQRTTPKA